MTQVLRAQGLSRTGITLRPHYKNGQPPLSIPPAEQPYNPRKHHLTHRPRSLGLIFDRAAFSAPYATPVAIDIQIKAAQSDVYYLPAELARHTEWLQRAIDRQHNLTPTAFTQGAYLQLRQNVASPASYWHYDIGNPSKTFLIVDDNPTLYADRFPLRLPEALRKHFGPAASLPQNMARDLLLSATDFNRLVAYHKNKLPTLRFLPYEIVEHDHLAVHKGFPKAGRTLGTIGFIDSDQPSLYVFPDLTNPMQPDLAKSKTAHAAEAAERLQRYLKRFPPVLT